MKYFLACLFLFGVLAGCKPKVISGVELENKLISTMDEHLHKTLPGAEFTIKEVVYYAQPQEKNYICQFKVHMHVLNKDTTGIMKAIISNDFATVNRTQ